jgi:hypothetical protein
MNVLMWLHMITETYSVDYIILKDASTGAILKYELNKVMHDDKYSSILKAIKDGYFLLNKEDAEYLNVPHYTTQGEKDKWTVQ